jgi:type II secretory ATPase GspE/PulE/Tfp pilus assembly ATPase PilB-like protein
VGVFELLRIDDELRDAIIRRAPRTELRAMARRNGMESLRQDGWTKVVQGITTVDEVLRVTEA